MKNKFYITTAIAYLNGKPHMWHALEIIIADSLARMHRLSGKNVEFQTWTDENGTKNWRTSQKENMEIRDFLDRNVEYFLDMYSKLKISYNTFIRTSDTQKHYPWAKKLWEELQKAWDIYKKSYEWLYCEGCEAFKMEKDLIEGKCPDHPTKDIERVQEENYFFRLSKYRDEIANRIKNNEYKIVPESRKNEILSFLEKAEDISFSRPISSLPRGIPVPEDEKHVMYVWCDALANYLTGQGYGTNDEWIKSWPADIHIIGKDILRFHAAFWPAMLLSAKIELPKKLLAHGFLNLNGQKMGKSTGNTIDPMDPINKYGRDGLTFNLLYDISPSQDGDFNMNRLDDVYNSMLIWSWGNLVNRVISLCNKYEIHEWIKWNYPDWFWNINLDKLNNFLEKDDTKWYLEEWYKVVQKANEFISSSEPWKKYKDESTQEEAINDLKFLLYIVKNLAILSSPILVDGFEKIKEIFGNEKLNIINTTENMDIKNIQEAWDMESFDVQLNPQIIYPRID